MKNTPVSSHGVPAAFENKPSVRHSPGTWHVLKNDGWHSSPIHIENEEGPVAVASPIGGVDEQRSNAKLIAAAPDMLNALQAMDFAIKQAVETYGENSPMTSSMVSAAIMVRAVIAKATP